MGKKQIEQSVYIHEKDLNKKSSVENEYQFQKRIQHKNLGRVDLFIHSQSREVLFKRTEIFSEKLEALYAIDFFKRLLSLQSQFVLTLKDYSVKTDSGLCSTSYIISAYYPFQNKTLFKHMQDIIKIQKDLTEIELLQIMYSILLGIQDLKNNGITVHDICPSRIYFDPQTLETKILLCDQLSNYELDECKSFQLKKIMEKQDIFVSPLLYQNLKQNNINFYLDQDKENSFALGLTLLQAGVNTPIQDVYGNQQEINIPKLQNHIENFKFKYEPRSTLLYQCVLNLLQSSHSQRITPQSLYSKIPPYNQMRPFLVPSYLREQKQNGYPQDANPFNNIVEQSQSVFFNPLKESYMNVQNTQQNQQNAYTGINRGVFNQIESQNNNQKVVGFQTSNQHNNQYQYNNNQNVNYQVHQQPIGQNYQVHQQPTGQNYQVHQQPTGQNQQPIQQNNTIDYFDVSYEKPQQKQNVFYAPLNDQQKDNKFQKNYQKSLSIYSNLFQTQDFLEVTQTPDAIRNKEQQIQQLHQYQQKQQKYSHQRFKNDTQQQRRNHSQNRIQYKTNDNQSNPLIYVYNQQQPHFINTQNYTNKQFINKN